MDDKPSKPRSTYANASLEVRTIADAVLGLAFVALLKLLPLYDDVRFMTLAIAFLSVDLLRYILTKAGITGRGKEAPRQ